MAKISLVCKDITSLPYDSVQRNKNLLGVNKSKSHYCCTALEAVDCTSLNQDILAEFVSALTSS